MHFSGRIGMSVKIEWQIFKAETQSDGTWRSNSPALEELLNAVAGPEKIKEPFQDVEYSMARLAIKGLPYFKITEVTSRNNREKNRASNSSVVNYHKFAGKNC
jgi:hypothetical protein